MKHLVNELFGKTEPTTKYGSVIKRIKPGRYEVRLDAGNIIQADTTLTWYPGARVVIQLGRIVDGDGTAQTIKNYEV